MEIILVNEVSVDVQCSASFIYLFMTRRNYNKSKHGSATT
jgi:hypothetical protein